MFRLYLGPLLLLVSFALASGQTAPSDSDPLHAAAAGARDRGDLPGAVELYRQAVAADPHWAEGWWFLGNLEYRQDHFQPAQEALSQYIALSPKAVAALALRGLCEYESGEFPESLADIQQAISLGAATQPRNAKILLYHEALLLTRLGRFEEAIAKYTAFVKGGETNPEVAVGLGLAGLRLPVLPQSASPDDLRLAGMAGEAGFKIIAEDTAAGRAAFQQTLAAYPNHPNLHYFCGYLMLSSDPDQAIEEMQEELALVPANSLARTMLAWTLELRGDFPAALPVARQAVAEAPSSPTNQLVMGRALLEAGDTKAALPYLDRALAADQNNVEAHMSLAKAYSELGRKDEAHQQRVLCLQLASKDLPGLGAQ